MKTLRSNPRITYKDASQQDLIGYYGVHPPYCIRAIIFYQDGEAVGIGGWKIEGGQYVVFSEIKEGVKLAKTTVFRCGKVIMDLVAEKGSPMYAASHNHKLLEKLGFKHFETVSDKREFYQWHN